jgi:hypothetical protein
MKKLQLSSHSRDTLEAVLRIVKSYRNGLKQIGHRAKLLDPKSPPPIEVVIEYATGMTVESATSYAQKCIEILFPSFSGEKFILRENGLLTGGVRVFVGDDMVDVSYQRLQTLLKN